MNDGDAPYPPDAYAPNGILWWKLLTEPGKKRRYGAERKLAAWLAYNLDVGDTFTLRDLREAIGDDGQANDDEHLNRRLRNLRPDGWILPSNNDDKSLPIGVYRVDQKGWHPGLGKRDVRDDISAGMRRRVLERDGRRCVICGVGQGEPYPGEPASKAVLTIGHRVARELGGSSKDINNLQAECKRCNEPVREELGNPETLDDVMLDLKRLRREELQRLLSWIDHGYRTRDRLDVLFDRYRALSAGERVDLAEEVRRRLGGR